MPWSKSNTIPSLKNKPEKIKEVFAEAANAALAKGRSEEEAVFTGLGAVTAYEKKHSTQKAVFKIKPPVEPPVASGSTPLINPAFLPKNRLNPNPERSLISADFNKEDKLVLTFDTGEKIVTSPVAKGDSYQQVGVQVNPVFDYLLFNTEAGITPDIAGMLAWNKFEDCLDIRQADGTILQVGLENSIPVINNSGAPLPNGSVVHFSGVDLVEIPEVLPFIADGSIEPLYLVGVLTNTLEVGQVGRATVLGKVRNLDTTGSTYGEVWNQGDLLWAHPTIPGGFTKVRPTAPNLNISVAAILKLSATDGILLVRPTVFPRLFYGDFSDSTNQTIALANTPYAVKFNTTNISSGVRVDPLVTSRIICSNAGLYSFDFKLQVVSSNSSKKEVYIWARKNGVDIPRSTSTITVVGNAVEHVPSWNFIVSMQAGDYFELMYAATDVSITLNAPATTSFCPSTPSATLKVNQVNL